MRRCTIASVVLGEGTNRQSLDEGNGNAGQECKQLRTELAWVYEKWKAGWGTLCRLRENHSKRLKRKKKVIDPYLRSLRNAELWDKHGQSKVHEPP